MLVHQRVTITPRPLSFPRRLAMVMTVSTHHACPKCKTARLTPALDSGGPACTEGDLMVLRCERCQGMWLSQDMVDCAIRSEGAAGPDDVGEGSAGEGADQRTGLCPLGHGILIRARVRLDDPFFLERCPHCGGIWFDAGEWRRLASSHLLQHLRDFWTPGWRRQHREQALREAYLESLRTDLGPELLDQLRDLAANLKDHPHRERALAFLRQEVVAPAKDDRDR